MITIEQAAQHAKNRFRLNLPAKESEVIAFEEKYAITLPTEYRDFILQIGNGSNDPPLPLFALGHQGEYRGILKLLQLPFPHIASWNEEDTCSDTYYDLAHVQGALPILHEGCGYHHFLVVTGTERGHIWFDGRVSDGGIIPLGFTENMNDRLTFFEWFRYWDLDSGGWLR